MSVSPIQQFTVNLCHKQRRFFRVTVVLGERSGCFHVQLYRLANSLCILSSCSVFLNDNSMQFSCIYTSCFKPKQKLTFALPSVESCSYSNTCCCIGLYLLSCTWNVSFEALGSVWFFHYQCLMSGLNMRMHCMICACETLCVTEFHLILLAFLKAAHLQCT